MNFLGRILAHRRSILSAGDNGDCVLCGWVLDVSVRLCDFEIVYADFCRRRTLPDYQKRTLIMSLEHLIIITSVVNTVVNILREICEWYWDKNKRE